MHFKNKSDNYIARAIIAKIKKTRYKPINNLVFTKELLNNFKKYIIKRCSIEWKYMCMVSEQFNNICEDYIIFL